MYLLYIICGLMLLIVLALANLGLTAAAFDQQAKMQKDIRDLKERTL